MEAILEGLAFANEVRDGRDHERGRSRGATRPPPISAERLRDHALSDSASITRICPGGPRELVDDAIHGAAAVVV